MVKAATATWLNKIAKEKTNLLQEMFDMEPIHVQVIDPKTKKEKPHCQGEDIVYIWDKIYGQDKMMQDIVVETVTGPSTPGKDYVDDPTANPAMPYQQLRALVGDGGKWKWPEIWKNLVSFIPNQTYKRHWLEFHLTTKDQRFHHCDPWVGFVATTWTRMAPY